MADEFRGSLGAQWIAETQRGGPKPPVSWKVLDKNPHLGQTQSAPKKKKKEESGSEGDHISDSGRELVSNAGIIRL